jgi:hypothetical protein
MPDATNKLFLKECSQELRIASVADEGGYKINSDGSDSSSEAHQ